MCDEMMSTIHSDRDVATKNISFYEKCIFAEVQLNGQDFLVNISLKIDIYNGHQKYV